MGLDQVKELTHQTIQRIIRFAPFLSVGDFLTRVDPRTQEAENLVRVGALEGLGNISLRSCGNCRRTAGSKIS